MAIASMASVPIDTQKLRFLKIEIFDTVLF